MYFKKSIVLSCCCDLCPAVFFEKNCILHRNVIYSQTIHILFSNFMSVNFMSGIFSQPVYLLGKGAGIDAWSDK